ncbi:MAG: DUF1667 domain-containing protein [Raoultibacter sp.]|jgi:CxxC motif-containing protein
MRRAEELKTLTCICCPRGCQLELSLDNQGAIVDVSGYSCIEGKRYAIDECRDPRRMITSLVYVEGFLEPLSVKTSRAVPKGLIDEVIQEIRAIEVCGPICAGDVLINDVCGTGVSVVATKSLGLCE